MYVRRQSCEQGGSAYNREFATAEDSATSVDLMYKQWPYKTRVHGLVAD